MSGPFLFLIPSADYQNWWWIYYICLGNGSFQWQYCSSNCLPLFFLLLPCMAYYFEPVWHHGALAIQPAMKKHKKSYLPNKTLLVYEEHKHMEKGCLLTGQNHFIYLFILLWVRTRLGDDNLFITRGYKRREKPSLLVQIIIIKVNLE